MRVVAVRAFVYSLPDGRAFRVRAGDEFDLPRGSNWLDIGLVRPVHDSTKVVRQPNNGHKSRKVVEIE